MSIRIGGPAYPLDGYGATGFVFVTGLKNEYLPSTGVPTIKPSDNLFSIWGGDDNIHEVLNFFTLNPRHPNPETLPTPTHVGRRVKYWAVLRNGLNGQKTGTVASHYICGDDCGGAFGQETYSIRYDDTGETGSPHLAKECELVGEPVQIDHYGKKYQLVDNGLQPSGIKSLS